MRHVLALSLALLLPPAAAPMPAGPSVAPVISNLRVVHSPPAPRPDEVFALGSGVDFLDPDGDLVGGACRLESATGQVIARPLIVTSESTPSNATSGVAACITTGRFLGVNISLTVVLVDRQGHVSNRLTAVVALGQRPRRLPPI
jgi:hypothetical protein